MGKEVVPGQALPVSHFSLEMVDFLPVGEPHDLEYEHPPSVAVAVSRGEVSRVNCLCMVKQAPRCQYSQSSFRTVLSALAPEGQTRARAARPTPCKLQKLPAGTGSCPYPALI